MDSSIEDYPLLLSNIADILQTDWKLGTALLIGQNIDLDLFVYHLLDNYDQYFVNDVFNFRHNYGSTYYIFGNKGDDNHYKYNYPLVDEVDKWIKAELIEMIGKHYG